MTATLAPVSHRPAAALARAAWLDAIGAPGVAVVDVEWTSEVKPAAAHKGVTLTKVVRAKAMVGVEYANLAVNNDTQTGELPWGEWVEGLYPYVIEHKGREYARLYTVDGSLTSTYFVDGLEIERDEFLSFLTPGARKARRPKGGTIVVKIENLRVV